MAPECPEEEAGNRWKAVEEMDKVLERLEGRMDRITAVIQSTSVQEKLLAPAALLKWRSARARGFLGSSPKEHRIFNIEPAATKTKETPEEKLTRWQSEILGSANMTECISSLFTQGRGLGGGE
jgi:hypothetical protein